MCRSSVSGLLRTTDTTGPWGLTTINPMHITITKAMGKYMRVIFCNRQIRTSHALRPGHRYLQQEGWR